jgi:NhaA family Na+:H+ antiporter
VTTPQLFDRGTWPEASRIADILRTETTGGVLLLAATVVALGWANSPWSSAYHELAGFSLGPLSLAGWAADGLLAIFFFVAGLELKREFVAGDLRDPRRAALPVAAAVGGMAVPALIFVLVALGTDALRGWAIPTATDIAFALAVLAVISTHLPAALRTFLLTLAVVDDLLAITVIAVFYTSSLHLLPLAAAVLPLAAFAVLVQRRVRSWWLLLPLAAAAWLLVHESGIHATVAGVLLAFAVPVRRRAPGEGPGLAEHFEHRWRPLSAGVAVPVFAFFAAGVSVTGAGGLANTVTLGIVLALVLGKAAGITGATWLVQRFTRARLAEGLSWWDVLGLALLGGIGFTVSLLISELAYGAGSVHDDRAKLGILLGSLIAALLATVILRARNRHYRQLRAEEAVDADADGVPDVYRRGDDLRT